MAIKYFLPLEEFKRMTILERPYAYDYINNIAYNRKAYKKLKKDNQ